MLGEGLGGPEGGGHEVVCGVAGFSQRHGPRGTQGRTGGAAALGL